MLQNIKQQEKHSETLGFHVFMEKEAESILQFLDKKSPNVTLVFF